MASRRPQGAPAAAGWPHVCGNGRLQQTARSLAALRAGCTGSGPGAGQGGRCTAHLGALRGRGGGRALQVGARLVTVRAADGRIVGKRTGESARRELRNSF